MRKTILSLLVSVGLIGSATAAIITDTFSYTGDYQIYTVPQNTTSLLFDLLGAGGGNDHYGSNSGGTGSRVTGTLSVYPGETLYVFIGGAGSDSTGGYGIDVGTGKGGFNGGGNSDGWWGTASGGGGGATDIRIGGIDLANRVIVAAGGGGAGNVGYTIWNSAGGGDNGNYNNTLGQGSSGANWTSSWGSGGGGYYGGQANLISLSGSGTGGKSYVDSNLTSGTLITPGGSDLFLTPLNGQALFTAVPEPSTYALFGIGAIGMLMVMRRKKAV